MTCPAHALAASRRMLVREDVDLIRELVKDRLKSSTPPAHMVRVVDLGAGSGTAALAVFAEAPPGRVRVITVDNEAEALDWAGLAVGNIERADDWERIQADAADSSSLLPTTREGPNIDLLLVDAEHAYQAVKDELAAWLPLLREGGLVWVHDYGDPKDFGLHSKVTPGVKRAVNELVRKGELEEIETRGLGWAGKKASYLR